MSIEEPADQHYELSSSKDEIGGEQIQKASQGNYEKLGLIEEPK